MSLKVQAMRIRKQWMKWLYDCHLPHQLLSEKQETDLSNQLSEKTLKWGKGLSYEVESVQFSDSAFVIMDCLKLLNFKDVVVFLGQAPLPIAIVLDVDLLGKIFAEVANNEDMTSICTTTADGRATFDLTSNEATLGELFLSASGTLEPLVGHVKKRLPGGESFIGN